MSKFKVEEARIIIEVQDGILEKRDYRIDPREVTVNGTLLSELLKEHARAQTRTGVIR